VLYSSKGAADVVVSYKTWAVQRGFRGDFDRDCPVPCAVSWNAKVELNFQPEKLLQVLIGFLTLEITADVEGDF
jgi:hypothetical protein